MNMVIFKIDDRLKVLLMNDQSYYNLQVGRVRANPK